MRRSLSVRTVQRLSMHAKRRDLTMSEHQNVATVNRLTQAILGDDLSALAGVVSEDLEFHVRGAIPMAGDYAGPEGVREVLGGIIAATGGDVKIEQRFCVGTDGWAAEWEHSELGRKGRTLESDNAFVYRFDSGRVAEMWMFIGAPAGSEAFFD
jgi:ketosteroid isomerase-like protein